MKGGFLVFGGDSLRFLSTAGVVGAPVKMFPVNDVAATTDATGASFATLVSDGVRFLHAQGTLVDPVDVSTPFVLPAASASSDHIGLDGIGGRIGLFYDAQAYDKKVHVARPGCL